MEILSKSLISSSNPSGEKILPTDWGTIIGAGISSAPNDPNDTGARRVLCIRTTLGAVAVYFSPSNIVPTPEEIQSSFFCATTTYGIEYTEDFNSGYWTTSANKHSYPEGRRCPAIAIIRYNGRFGWRYKSGSNDENLVRTFSPGLASGSGWEVINGSKSNQVTGYTFDVSPNGTLTIIYKNEIIMSFR